MTEFQVEDFDFMSVAHWEQTTAYWIIFHFIFVRSNLARFMQLSETRMPMGNW